MVNEEEQKEDTTTIESKTNENDMEIVTKEVIADSENNENKEVELDKEEEKMEDVSQNETVVNVRGKMIA